MLLSIIVTLFGIAFLLLFYGFYCKTDMPRLLGFLLIFLLGTFFEPAIPGNVEYKSGEAIRELYIYGDNYSTFHWSHDSDVPVCVPNNLDCVKLFHLNTTISDVYSEYNNHTIGFYLMLTGILGFVLVMVDRREEERE